MPKKVTKPDKKPIKRKEQLRTIENKKALILAMIDSLGNVTAACQKTDLSRETYYGYINDDPEFKATIEDIPEIRLDFVENKLNKLIKKDHPAAIIFFLKTKGKGRGYIERTEIDANVHADKLTGEHFSEAWKKAQEKEKPKVKPKKKAKNKELKK